MCCQQVHRTENIRSLIMYQNLQKCMKYANGGGGDVEYESYVYHGCAPNKVEAIVANGLNRSLCKSDGTPIDLFI